MASAKQGRGPWKSLFGFRCPHCHEGEFFVDRNPYRLSTIGDVRESCSVCGRSYSKEPGFYYGAMYVAYALGVATFVSVYVAMIVLFPEASTEMYVGVVLAALLLLTPFLFALSKIIWANMFISYKGPAKKGQSGA
ncbi:MAG: DUF983 domain-containing protein [Flavobacteriales bacterium]|nr:DUF983 domain-containing protein [Flavobacteriales bacterium]